jgi:phage gpG-like protein
MLTKIETNFDFSKALKDLDETIDDTMAEVGGENVKSIKQTIDNLGYGQYPALTKKRIENRKLGIGFPDGTKATDRFPGIPLKQTGNLYNSIQAKKDGIHMASYGITHNHGLPDKKVPKHVMPGRPFITIGMSRVDLSKIEDNFTKKIKKLIKK